VELGWLLDDGRLCVGASQIGFAMVAYSDPNAIRFARWADAERTRRVLSVIGMPITAAHVKPVEHAWMNEPLRYDA